MADDLIPKRDRIQNEHENFALNLNDKIIRRVEDEASIVVLNQILAALGVGTGAVWSLFGPLIIPPTSTVVVDTNLLSSFSRIDYVLNFKDDPITITKSLKLVAQNNAGTVSDMVTERMGGNMDIAVNFTDDSVDGFLELTNNESFAVTLTFLRAILP